MVTVPVVLNLVGMTRTSVDIMPGLEPYTAVRYAPNGARVPFYPFDHPGGSAVWSSAHDLVRFGMYHLHNTLEVMRQCGMASALCIPTENDLPTSTQTWIHGIL